MRVKDGHVYLNGKRLAESYLAAGMKTLTADQREKAVQLGADEYFLLGDNRTVSEDSRFYGAVSRDHIIGMISSQ